MATMKNKPKTTARNIKRPKQHTHKHEAGAPLLARLSGLITLPKGQTADDVRFQALVEKYGRLSENGRSYCPQPRRFSQARQSAGAAAGGIPPATTRVDADPPRLSLGQAHCRTAHSPFTAYCLLLTAYCLPLTAHCLLFTSPSPLPASPPAAPGDTPCSSRRGRARRARRRACSSCPPRRGR